MSTSLDGLLSRDTGVIIVAAGQGSRFGGMVPKQYLELLGVRVVFRAMRPFLLHPDVAEVVLVLPPDDAAHPPEWLAPHLGGILSVVAGGVSRSDSVRAGLAALSPRSHVVLVHDGARPFVPIDLIDSCIQNARAGVSVVPAMPVTDTLKRADAAHHVIGTVPRGGLWRAQTPEAFPRDVLVRAYAANNDNTLVTDDATLVEAMGEPVTLIPGSASNLKITTAEDLALAEWYLGRL